MRCDGQHRIIRYACPLIRCRSGSDFNTELHGLHYLSDGERTPLPVGGADYANLGSTDVEGSTVIWFGIGGRLKFNPRTSIGATYEYPLTNRDADIFGDRVTVDFIVSW